MKKVLIAGACLIVVVICVVFVVGILNLGSIIKTAVNTVGPEIVKTGVEVADVDVSVLSTQAQLNGFILENPQGFTTPMAFQVETILVDIDEFSLIKDTIVIDRILIGNPEITYEIKGRTDNFRTIIAQMEEGAEPEERSGKKSSADKKGKNLLIRDLVIKGGRVNMAVPILKGKVVTAVLPDIHLRNIGQGDKGASPEDVFLAVFQEVHKVMTSPELTKEFAEQLKTLGIVFDGRDVREQIKETRERFKDVKSEIKDLRKQIKGLFDQ